MPSFVVISDVHANLEALLAVLRHIDQEQIDEIFFLGDCVGYGPNPNECTEIVREKTGICIAGNHDWGAVGLTDISYFNPYAQSALAWTGTVLTTENKDFIMKLPLTISLTDIRALFVHGSPFEPERWHYITTEYDAATAFLECHESFIFVGHSHVPFIIEKLKNGRMRFHYDRAEINRNSRYIVNAGSVGQPRDGNPEAAYVLMRKEYIVIKRVSYDIVETQEKMRKAELPSYLIERLSMGV